MSFPLKIPFYAFKIHLSSGNSILSPLSDESAVRISESMQEVAKKYAEELQEKVLNKGKYDKVLIEYQQGEFFKSQIGVVFGNARDKISYQAFSIEFDFFYKENEGGYWGIVPVLRVESQANTMELLKHRLSEAIKIYFVKNKKLQRVQQIISSIWFEGVELLQTEMTLKSFSPKEIEGLNAEKKTRLLPKVARPIKISKQVVYGRETELAQIRQCLSNKFSRNILLVGPSGVGKTALVWEIARKATSKNQIWETTASILIKELTGDTGWQDNLAFLCKELSKDNTLLFIRNLMELFEVGKYEGNSVSIADYLRTYITRGEITLISECTEEEFAQIELRSPNYLSYFQIIRLEEPGNKLEEIILKKVQNIASSKEVSIAEEAIKEVIRLNKRFTPYAGMPGKPIRFLESILVSRKGGGLYRTSKALKIDKQVILEHFCEESGMPRFMIDPAIPMNIQDIRKNFNEKVYGQDRAVESLTNILARVKTALAKTGKPIASFFFVGPTGVGKTELAKVLAEFMFGNRNKLMRFDMSEFSSPYSVMRLIGTDYNSDGILTSAIRREPFSVLLFDEIEKAHPNFYDLLLQVLSEGRLTDSQGKLVNLCSTIIIMTSNVGATRLQTGTISWKKDTNTKVIQDYYLSAVQKFFRPELLNRIDEIIPFESLDAITIRFIVEREVNLFKAREGIKFRKMTLDIDETVLDYLGEKGYHPKYGARFLQRTIREEILVPLAHELNEYDFDDQLIVSLKMEEQTPSIHIENDPMGLDLLIEELDMINHANYSSDLRRQIVQLQEGSLFIRLLSQLDILEREKVELKQKFWNQKSKADNYTNSLQLKEEVAQLLQEIEGHELELNMASLSLTNYHTGVVKEVENWEKAFFQIKKALYMKLTPKSNRCFISVYGAEMRPLTVFYKELFKALNLDFTAAAVWFRESFYYRDIPENEQGKSEEKYIKTILNLNEDDFEFKPTKSQDTLYGIEFVVNGPCAYLFLMEEEGHQKWTFDSKGPKWYHIKVSNDPFFTPDKIHRKEYYSRQNTRRTIEPGIFKDNTYKINRQLQQNQIIPYLVEKLKERFKVKLNLEVM